MSITESTIEVASKWGRPAHYQYWKQSEGSDRLWIALPGQNYSLDAPLLWYAVRAALQANCDVLGVEYGFQSNRQSLQQEDFPVVVSEASEAIATFLEDKNYNSIGYLAKSLGTVVATRLALGQPGDEHAYLTPLRSTIPFIQKSSRMLVLVGSQDPLFTADDVEKVAGVSGVQVHVISGANHAMEIEGDTQRSLDALSQTIALFQSHL